jgi:hypothetical protein
MTPREELDLLRKEKRYKDLLAKSGGVTEETAPQPQPVDTSPIDYGMRDELVNTATFGLADRVKAAGETAAQIPFDLYDGKDLNISDSYDKRLSGIHGERDRYRKKHPYKSLGAGVVGGLANPLANVVSKYATGGKLTGSGLNQATKFGAGRAKVLGKKSQGLGQAMRRGALGGSGIAGYQAFNEADGDFLDRINSAQTAVALGGATGAGMPAAIKGVASGTRFLTDQLFRGSKHRQRSMALRKIAEALEADGLTPDQAVRRINQLGPEGALLDVGDESRMLAYAVSKRSEKGAKNIADKVEGRQWGERDPISGAKVGGQVKRLKGTLDDLGYGKVGKREELAKSQKEAKELYDKAFRANLNIDSKEIHAILKRLPDEIKVRARQAMNLKGENVSKVNPELTALGKEQGITTGKGIGEGLKLKYLDSIKKQLWDASEDTRNLKTGRLTDIGGAYNTLRKELTVAMDDADATGFYARARAKAGDKLSNESAWRQGERFMSDSEFADADILAGEINKMSPNELHHFRVGVVEKLKRLVGKKKEGADATGVLLGSDNIEDRIKFVFESDEGLFKKYVDAVQKEQTMYRGYGVRQNSQSAEKINALLKSQEDPAQELQGAVKMAQGGILNQLGGAKDVAQGLWKRLSAPEESTRQLSKMLTGKGGDLQGLKNKYTAQEMSRRIQNQLSNLGTRSVAPYIGRRERKKGMLSN